VVWIVDQRTDWTAGGVAPAACWETAGGDDPVYGPIRDELLARAAAGRRLVIAVHGFNVKRASAIRAYVALEQALNLDPATHLFLGVCWPGDWIIPVINYSFESKDANRCGRELADYLRRVAPDAVAYDLVSHSLGARVLLTAAQRLGDRVGRICIAAGAIDDNALAKEFAGLGARRISILSSEKDKVLRLAYPVGDFLADVFLGDKDAPWRGALGFHGPKPRNTPTDLAFHAISKSEKYDHGDYFPPGVTKPKAGRWQRAVGYMESAVKGLDRPW
jgi:hypothetical protein